MLAAIARPGAAKLALASISSVHWSDGGLVDLEQRRAGVARGRRGAGGGCHAHAGMLDLTCSARSGFPGVSDLQVGAGAVWAGVPVCGETLAGRRAAGADRIGPARGGRRTTSICATRLRGDARRFDMGERDFFISLEMAAIGMELVAEWGTAAITERLSMLTGRLAEGLPNAGVDGPRRASARAACVESGFSGRHAAGLPERLAAENVFVARGWAGCASARMSTTTRRMWTGSWRCSAR